MIKITVKSFEELDCSQLYHVLQLRSEIFVVEQDCVYQDLDGKDQKALHIIGTKSDEIVAYSRIFKAGDYVAQASIGRVVVKANERKYGYGIAMMQAAIQAIEEHFQETSIMVSAQTYLKQFYNALGFIEKGATYLEDGIPHILMVKD